MRPRTTAFDDQILAFLHDHSGGVTAHEIASTLAGRELHSTECGSVQLSLRRMRTIGLVASEPTHDWVPPTELDRDVVGYWRHGNQLVWRAVEPMTDLSDLLGASDAVYRPEATP